MLGWLVGYTIASIVTAFIVVRLFDYIFTGLTDGWANFIKFCLFVLTWTAVTAKGGMHSFSRQVKRIRQGNRALMNRISAPTKSDGQ